MTFDFFRSEFPESSVTGKEFSHPGREQGKDFASSVSLLISNHCGDIVGFLEIMPTGRKKSGRDLSKEHGDVVEKDENDQTSNDTIGDVVCRQENRDQKKEVSV